MRGGTERTRRSGAERTSRGTKVTGCHATRSGTGSCSGLWWSRWRLLLLLWLLLLRHLLVTDRPLVADSSGAADSATLLESDVLVEILIELLVCDARLRRDVDVVVISEGQRRSGRLDGVNWKAIIAFFKIGFNVTKTNAIRIKFFC